VFDLLIAALPIVIAAVAARKISGLDEAGIVAGALAGILAQSGGIFGGLVGGILAGLLASFLIRWMLAHRFPATTANIFAGALAGLIPGLVVFFLLAPFTRLLGDWVRIGIEQAVAFSPLLAGALAGLAMWPAIIGGVYHSVILPLVLLEMGEKGHSFFGAIDMVALVMVSLGITLANVIRPRTSGERALAGSGAAVNFFFGTFVESSYPFMFGDKRVFAIALIAATTGGTLVGVTGAEATAYLPAVVAPFIATNVWGMVLAMAVSFAIAFSLTLLVNLSVTRRVRAGAVAAAA
jgi:fructose-specific phosphotransferase system IIC component